MKTGFRRRAACAIAALASLPATLQAADTALVYNKTYTCGTELIQVAYCRRDSDMPGYPRTVDADNWCHIYYLDRPKNGLGGTAFGTELKGDVEKRLRACGAIASGSAPQAATGKPTTQATAPAANSRSAAEKQAWAVYEEAGALAKAGNDAAAIEAYRRSNSIHPQPGTWSDLGHAYYRLKRYPDAIAAYKQSLALNPANANAHLGAGLTLYDNRQYAESLPYLREGLRLKPETDWAHNTLGNALFGLEKYADAEPSYRAAIRLKPSEALYHQNLADDLYFQKRYPDAVASAREAIRLDPKRPAAHNILGHALFDQKLYPDAIKAYQDALRLDASVAIYHYNLANAYSASNQREKSIPSFQEAVRLQPTDNRAWNDLGISLYILKRYPEALAAIQKARDLKPNENLYLGNHAFVLARMGRLPEAAQIASKLTSAGDQQAKDLQTEIDTQSGRITLAMKPVRPAGAKNPKIEMVWVAPGSFTMGGGFTDSLPAHKVTIATGFYIGKYEVTQAQWKAVMGGNPSEFSKCGDNCPVEQVTWEAAQVFVKFLNDANDGYLYRLPSEAEWEYAFRAGTTGQHYADGEIGWNGSNSGDKTHPVGQLKPNALGLYDIAGNVGEWCSDWYHANYEGAPTDGRPWVEGGDPNRRVVRGGTFFAPFTSMNATTRLEDPPNYQSRTIGLRVVAVKKN